MKILFISSWFPYPPINGAKIRVYNLIRELSKQHEITLLSFVRTFTPAEAGSNISHLETFCKTVKIVQAQPYKPSLASAIKGVFSYKPISVIQTYSQQMEDLIEMTKDSEEFDVIIASEVNMPHMVSLLASKIKGIPKVLDAIEVALALDAYKTETSFLRRIRKGLTWLKLRGYTKSLLQKADACTVPSEQERENLLEIIPGYKNLKVIPHSLDLSQYSGPYEAPYPNSLVYTGSFSYYANKDAAYYFLQDIYPEIKKMIPEATLKIIGNTNGAPLNEWPVDDSVDFTGLLYDVRPPVAESWLSVVPLRVGAGTRLKIIESMALGTPVVSTSKGAEGLDVVNGENILIADTAIGFANAVVSIVSSPELRAKLSQNGKKLIEQKYSSEVMGSSFNEFLNEIVSSKF